MNSLLSEEPLGGVRKKRPGLRRRHLVKALQPMLERIDEVTVNEINEAAAVGTAWHTLARGGEVAPSVSASAWRASEQPTRADLSFGETRRRRYAALWLRPLKKKGKGKPPKVPQYIEEHDGSGSDVYYLLKKLEEIDPVPVECRASTPLFRKVSGAGARAKYSHLTVKDLRKAQRNFAKAAGRADWASFGAHSARIGGATDLAESGKASEILLKAKGRWASDIGKIYARLTRRALLASSRPMQTARARDLEEIFPDFAQPA